jgi:hypothetical protein
MMAAGILVGYTVMPWRLRSGGGCSAMLILTAAPWVGRGCTMGMVLALSTAPMLSMGLRHMRAKALLHPLPGR